MHRIRPVDWGMGRRAESKDAVISTRSAREEV